MKTVCYIDIKHMLFKFEKGTFEKSSPNEHRGGWLYANISRYI